MTTCTIKFLEIFQEDKIVKGLEDLLPYRKAEVNCLQFAGVLSKCNSTQEKSKDCDLRLREFYECVARRLYPQVEDNYLKCITYTNNDPNVKKNCDLEFDNVMKVAIFPKKKFLQNNFILREDELETTTQIRRLFSSVIYLNLLGKYTTPKELSKRKQVVQEAIAKRQKDTLK